MNAPPPRGLAHERSYLRVLRRPPNAEEQDSLRRFLPPWLLELRLRASREHRRGIRPFVAAAARAWEEVAGAPARSEDLEHLLDRWRRTQSAGAFEWRSPPAVDGHARAEQSRALDRLFLELEDRQPDAATRHRFLARWSLGLDDEHSLREEMHRSLAEILLSSASWSASLGAVRGLIAAERAHYLLPPVTPREQLATFVRVARSYAGPGDLAAAVATGTVRRRLGIRPIKFEMDVTSQCNLRCRMCYLSDPTFGRRARIDFDIDVFRRLAAEVFPNCALVSLSFGAEPLLHPRIVELLEIVAAEEVPWRYLITNGLLLDAEMIDAFVRIPLHGFSVSIDAATAATYERIRRGGRWQQLVGNLRAIDAAKRRAGSHFPQVSLNFVLMRSNAHELPALVRLAPELGASGIAAMHLTPYDGLGLEGEGLDAEPERCNAILAEARAEADRLGLSIALPEPFGPPADSPAGPLKRAPPAGFMFPEAGSARGPCPFPWQFVGVDAYGKVVPCGHWYTEPPLGDVATQSFAQIWNGARWRELREEHASGRLRQTCRECPAAGMGSCDSPKAFRTVTLPR